MSKYPELDGLNTSDEVIDALQEIAEQDEAKFMDLWTDGCTQIHNKDEVEELVKEHIKAHVQDDELEDFYSWGIEKVWIEKIEIKHHLIKMKSGNTEVHIVSDEVNDFVPYIKTLMDWSNAWDYDAVEDWHSDEYYILHAVEGYFKVHNLSRDDKEGLFRGKYEGSPTPLEDYEDREIYAIVYMKISKEDYDKLSEYVEEDN